MEKYKRFFSEAKQVGILYHNTDLQGMLHILQNDILEESGHFGNTRKKTDAISLTRNKRYNYVYGMEKKYIYKLTIDGNKLSHNYEIYPKVDPRYGRKESEEQVKGPIRRIGKYILKIEYTNIKQNDINEISPLLLKAEDLLRIYLKKYPSIEIEFLLKEDLNSFKKEISGFYKNGKKIYSFMNENKDINKIYLDKIIERDTLEDIDIGNILSSSHYEILENALLEGFDSIIFDSERKAIVIHTSKKNKKLYENYLDKYSIFNFKLIFSYLEDLQDFLG